MRFVFLFAGFMVATNLLAAPLSLELDCDFGEGGILGRGFTGHDLVELYRGISSIPGKDEFESRSEYERRVEVSIGGMPSSVSRGMLCSGDLSTRVSPALDTWKYDAERKVYENVLFYTQSVGGRSGRYARLSHVDLSRKETRYDGVNIFGVSKTIGKTERRTIFLVDDGIRLRSLAWRIPGIKVDDSTIRVSLDMPGDVARGFSGNLRYVFQYRLVPPLISNHVDRELPTFSNPFEYVNEMKMVEVEVRKVAVVDARDGAVLRVFDFSKNL